MKILTVSSLALLITLMQNSSGEQSLANHGQGEFSGNLPSQFHEISAGEGLMTGEAVSGLNNGSKIIRYIYY